MKVSILIYYILLSLAAVLSLIKTKNDNRLLLFSLLLFLSLAEELLFEWLSDTNKGKNFYIIYHLFLPIYYGLLSGYLLQYLQKGVLKTGILIFILVFFPVSLFISYKLYGFEGYPSVAFNILGVLLIINCLVVLLNLDVTDNIPIIQKPVFWIGVLTILFYSGTFALMGVYDYLIKHQPKDKVDKLQGTINLFLNYFYYLFISFGMVCSKPTMKYSAQ